MVDFILKDPDNYVLNSALKKYKIDQDKFIHPRITYKNTYAKLKRSFPDKNLILKELRITDSISAFDFGDGIINNHGKGATKDQAKASSIMEFSERLSWLNFDYKNAPGYIKTTFFELQKNNNVEGTDKSFYIHHSNKQEELAEILRNIPMDWVHGYSLTNNKMIYYPLSWNNNYQSTNGLASGNIKEEAILQALCEVIERHNVSDLILKIGKIKTELIDLNSIDDNIIKKLLDSFKENNINIYIINATNYFNVSTIIAYGVDLNPEIELMKTSYGYGCHTDPKKAIIRALTEYYQCREGVIAKKDIATNIKLPKGQWQFKLNIDTDKIINESENISYKKLPNLSNNDIKIEINTLVELLKKQGYEVIIINKTHPLLKVPVYRVFVPGLLTGSTINTADENDDFLIVLSYYQSGMKDKAYEYYEKHFHELISKMDTIFSLYEQVWPGFNIENFKKFLQPKMCPLDKLFQDNYLEQIKTTINLLAGNNKDFIHKIFK